MGRWAGLMVCVAPLVWGSDSGPQRPHDLSEISIEELANLKITSVARKEQTLSRAAAAIYVIPHEEIQRSGATSIPELLRRVPGLQVARLDAHTWVVTARGFAGQFSNKLLVLMDGRSVYTNHFSGVYWDERDTLLEDIERIEVIRGPGATMWGANAVNGVINIITRRAADTEGAFLTAETGTQTTGFAAARYGFRLGTAFHARMFATYSNQRQLQYPSGSGGQDAWHVNRGGFRLDWELSRRDSLRLEGDVYGGDADTLTTIAALTPPFRRAIVDSTGLRGGSVLGTWERRFSEESKLELLLYYDGSVRDALISPVATDTANFDLQHSWQRGRHGLIWGFGHRVTRDSSDNNFTIAFTPPRHTDQLFNAFVQDEIALVEDRLTLTAGSKLEHNSYTGFEVEPNARLLWSPNARHGLWAAVSRAVRTPSRSDCCIRLNTAVIPSAQGPSLVSIFGTPEFQSEGLLAYEAGYRFQPARWVALDAASFYNVYDRLRSQEPARPFLENAPAPAHLVIPMQFTNKLSGSTHGLEIAGKWQPAARWKLSTGYAWLRLAMRQSGGVQTEAEFQENSSPRHQAQILSFLDLPGGLQLDTGFYYVDALAKIPHYVRADVRAGWRAGRGFEVSAGCENLLDRWHPEFWDRSQVFPDPLEVRRNLYVKLTWRFE